jgi:hypothetical protein
MSPCCSWRASGGLTARYFERIPRANVRLRVGEFARLWLTVEGRVDAFEAADREDFFLTGVQSTCRWLAGALISVKGVNGPTRVWSPSPISGAQVKAYEELIAEETIAAERAAVGSVPGEPDFVDGVLATLLSAWRWSGVPPIEVEQAQTG